MNAKSVTNLKLPRGGDETTQYKKSASGNDQNFNLSNYNDDTDRLKNTARQMGKESGKLERLDPSNDFKIYATQKFVFDENKQLYGIGQQIFQGRTNTAERASKKRRMTTNKSQKNVRGTFSQFKMLQ